MSKGVMMIRRLVIVTFVAAGILFAPFSAYAFDERPAGMTMKTETFDRDPGWVGVNNRTARTHEPRTVRQDFGFSARTANAGGQAAGEIGGFVSPAGEPAFYGKAIPATNLTRPLTASGTLSVGRGKTHLLIGFFNADTVKEWRTPNTIVLRLQGRGDKFYAYVEYCTAKWRAGGDSTPFPSMTSPKHGRRHAAGFPCGTRLNWTLAYDPQGNAGRGVVTATIGSETAICTLDESHKADGATFNRFGLLDVMKSADSGSEVWFDDIAINGGAPETFDRNPDWDGRNNRRTEASRLVRPWFDFGFSDTQFAGGKSKGELGGLIFRGDCRYAERMACYGDRVGPLTLDRPLKASGKIGMTRGVSDSTTLFGFFNSRDSMRQNPSQSNALPESVLGIHVEGPSRDGFRFYPVLRLKGGRSQIAPVSRYPFIHPDGKSHDWSLEYNPQGAHGKGQIIVALDADSATFDLESRDSQPQTTFDRFRIVTPWIDGNSQNVYWDDLAYTVGQE
jgi:hypothetical protein